MSLSYFVCVTEQLDDDPNVLNYVYFGHVFDDANDAAAFGGTYETFDTLDDVYERLSGCDDVLFNTPAR